MESGIKVLVLDDEIEICEAIRQFLTDKGFPVFIAHTIEEFNQKLEAHQPNFLILDKFINKRDAFPLIQQIRSLESHKAIPILVITGCEDFQEKIRALKMGADEVLIKPIRLEEMLVKMLALMRRSFSYQPLSENVNYKQLTLSPATHEVNVGEDPLHLTETEFKLLYELIVEKGRPVHREYLAYKGLTSRNNNFRTIDVHINALRSKLGTLGDKIKTLRGRGYMLVD